MMRFVTRTLEFGHNLGTRRWFGGLFPSADHWWFPLLAASLSAVAASPFGQTSALILGALLGMQWPELFGALLMGKGLKYTFIGAATAHRMVRWAHGCACNRLSGDTPIT